MRRRRRPSLHQRIEKASAQGEGPHLAATLSLDSFVILILILGFQVDGAHMTLQCTWLRECQATLITAIWAHVDVPQVVDYQAGALGEEAVTVAAVLTSEGGAEATWIWITLLEFFIGARRHGFKAGQFLAIQRSLLGLELGVFAIWEIAAPALVAMRLTAHCLATLVLRFLYMITLVIWCFGSGIWFRFFLFRYGHTLILNNWCGNFSSLMCLVISFWLRIDGLRLRLTLAFLLAVEDLPELVFGLDG